MSDFFLLLDSNLNFAQVQSSGSIISGQNVQNIIMVCFLGINDLNQCYIISISETRVKDFIIRLPFSRQESKLPFLGFGFQF